MAATRETVFQINEWVITPEGKVDRVREVCYGQGFDQYFLAHSGDAWWGEQDLRSESNEPFTP
jgi:hypothetical protein